MQPIYTANASVKANKNLKKAGAISDGAACLSIEDQQRRILEAYERFFVTVWKQNKGGSDFGAPASQVGVHANPKAGSGRFASSRRGSSRRPSFAVSA
jgi:hypothetical protein